VSLSKLRKFWTIASTYSSQEERAAHHVEKLGFQFYLPRYDSGEFSERRSLLFPGYLMIRISEGWESIIRTPGVQRLFMSDEFPKRIRDEDVDSIRLREDDRGLVRLRPRVEVGDHVRAEKGSYSGVEGIVQGMMARDRCQVLLRMLGREVTVELDERVLVAT